MSLKIIKAGLLDTIQDLGRYGYQHQGINPGGSMDRFSSALSNALLGKELNSPVIEMHFPAAQFLFETSCVICITGADFFPTINDIPVSTHQPIAVKEGSLLSWKGIDKGVRCYLSILNELKLEKWLGSFSTNLKAVAGGFKGRRLERYDALQLSKIQLPHIDDDFIGLPWKYNLHKPDPDEVELIPGSEWNWLTKKSQANLLNNSFKFTPASDRMGYRLGGDPLEQDSNEQLISSAVTFGTIQLLPNGQLIILMADHQATGGYPRIAHVISAHLPKLAQMNPNEELKFAMTDVKSAEEKFAAQQQYLIALQNTCNLKMQNWLNAH